MSEECNFQQNPNTRAVLLGGPAGGAGLQVAGGTVPVREAPDIRQVLPENTRQLPAQCEF